MITTNPPCGATCKRGSHTKMAPQGVQQSNLFISIGQQNVGFPYGAVYRFVDILNIKILAHCDK